MFAYCFMDGVVQFANQAPPGALTIGSCPKSATPKAWRTHVEQLCRLKRDRSGLRLIPGIPEAADDDAALKAACAFAKLLRKVPV